MPPFRCNQPSPPVWAGALGVADPHHRRSRSRYAAGDFSCARRGRVPVVFTGSVLILVIAVLLVPWLHATDKKSLLSVGFLWLALTVAFEFTFGHFVFGPSWEGLASDYNFLKAGLLLIGMAVLLFAPVIAARVQGR